DLRGGFVLSGGGSASARGVFKYVNRPRVVSLKFELQRGQFKGVEIDEDGIVVNREFGHGFTAKVDDAGGAGGAEASKAGDAATAFGFEKAKGQRGSDLRRGEWINVENLHVF